MLEPQFFLTSKVFPDNMKLTISTSEHQEMIDITDKVNKLVKKSNIDEGICHVFALHSTAGIIINENWDEDIPQDVFKAWNKAIPEHNNYEHDQVDGNAQSHILAATIGAGETIPVRQGELKLGRWQSVMLVELDGPRGNRNIEVTVMEK